jgi:hypothetical protein
VNTVGNAARVALGVQMRLLALANDLEQGKRAGLDADTAMQLNAINRDLGDAVALLVASEGVDVAYFSRH